ncbi:MAG: cytochrome c oxidase accessory protein CcoG [Pseudomonadota bacterium]
MNSAAARELYKKREPIYPKLVRGKFRKLKWFLLFGTLAVYYLLPWVRWPRGLDEPSQAVLVDFEGGRFYFFFIEIWPSELYYVTGLLILAAVGLFLATALLGRIWCGYTCPQTVWTDLFIAAERLIEGDRNQRIRLAKAPWSFDKIRKKVAKHAIWLLIAAMTGGAWILYFHDAPTIVRHFFTGEAPGSAYLFASILTFTTYTLAGTMREQVCTYMCPWPRIQAALTDEETLQVSYRGARGEPRGPHKKGEPWEGRGDCIDCKACVSACPMGIDIRDGDQLECINCALCIDACDEIMAKVARPTGLIAYDTHRNLNSSNRSDDTGDGSFKGSSRALKLIRSRTVFYAFVFVVVATVMLIGLSNRTSMEVSVLRDRTPPFVTLSDGSIRNAYTLKITNKLNTEREFTVSLKGDRHYDMQVVGEKVVREENSQFVKVKVAGDGSRSTRIFATLPSNANQKDPNMEDYPVEGSMPLQFLVSVGTGVAGDQTGDQSIDQTRYDTVFLTKRP